MWTYVTMEVRNIPSKISKAIRVGIKNIAPGYSFHLAQYWESYLLKLGNLESLSSFLSINLVSLQREYSMATIPKMACTTT